LEQPWGVLPRLSGVWSYEWQPKAARLLVTSRDMSERSIRLPDSLASEFNGCVRRILPKYQERDDLDDDVPDGKIVARIVTDTAHRISTRAHFDLDYGLYTFGG